MGDKRGIESSVGSRTQAPTSTRTPTPAPTRTRAGAHATPAHTHTHTYSPLPSFLPALPFSRTNTHTHAHTHSRYIYAHEHTHLSVGVGVQAKGRVGTRARPERVGARAEVGAADIDGAVRTLRHQSTRNTRAPRLVTHHSLPARGARPAGAADGGAQDSAFAARLWLIRL